MTGFKNIFNKHLCVMFAFGKRVCVGVGAEVLVKIDGAEVDPVKLCLFARAREVTNFLPP